MQDSSVVTRFAPSPTGYLHVGGARTALFNWLLARRVGGKFILRIEDTDRSRHIGDSLEKILSDFRWLGLDWDEGPEVGGHGGPYFQSQRLDIYELYVNRLLEQRLAYFALESPEQLTAMREKAQSEKQAFKYPRPDPLPTVDDGLAAREAGRAVTVRFKMPDKDIAVADRILGDVRIGRAELEDFVIQKSDGWPTYHFAVVVDDELMGVTHVLRGQEHLMNTPKHVALQDALGFRRPIYAHLPIIFNMNGSKMSKRDKANAEKKGITPPEIDVHDFRANGYLPEALVNFISLLGWSPGDNREHLTLEETVAAFDIDRIGSSNARFDRDKLIAFNTDWSAALKPARLLEAAKDFAAVSESPLANLDDERLAHLLRINEGFRTFRDVENKSAFLFVADDRVDYDEKATRKVLAKNDSAGYAMIAELSERLNSLSSWEPSGLEQLLKCVCEEKQTGLGNVAQPLRVAVTGSTVSPPIYDTLAMLGKESTLKRIRRVLTMRPE